MALTDNLQQYYAFEGNANDSVGSYNGTATNVTFGAPYGKISQGGDFSYSNSIIQTGGSFGSTGSFQLWFKLDSLSSESTLFVGNQNSNGSNNYFGCSIPTNGSLLLYHGASNNALQTTTGLVTTSTWNHLVITQNGSGIKCYLNNTERTLSGSFGGALSSTFWFSNVSSINQFCIGALKRGSQFYPGFDGGIDEVGYWSRGLTSGEVSQLYNGGAGLAYPLIPSSTSTSNFFF